MKKLPAKNQWDEKWLRESLWMPFGSMCNLLAQAYQGKEVDEKTFETLARKAFELSEEFTEKAYNRIEPKNADEPEIPIK